MNKQLLEHFTDFGFNVFGIIDVNKNRTEWK